MKKFLCTILILAVAFSAGACAFASAAASTATPTQTVSSETKASAAAPVQEVATTVVEQAQPVSTTQSVVAEVPVSTPEATSAPVPETTATDTAATTISGGGYVVDVVNASIVKDGLGNDVIGIHFKFTNNNSEEMAFVYIAMDTVRQDGKTLSMEGMVTNPADPTQTNLCTWVSNGQSVDVTYLYPYNSSDDIDFSLTLVKDLNSVTPLASGSCTLSLS